MYYLSSKITKSYKIHIQKMALYYISILLQVQSKYYTSLWSKLDVKHC